MKKNKVIITIILAVNLCLSGCTSQNETKETQPKEVMKTFDLVKDKSKLEAEWIDLISAFVYADNFVGNLSYNLQKDMPKDKFEKVKKLIDEVFGSNYKTLKDNQKKAQNNITKLGVSSPEFKKYNDLLQDLTKTQDSWVDSLVNVTYDDIPTVISDINSNTQTYLEKSSELGTLMTSAFTALGYDSNQSVEITIDVLFKATEKYGDPVDTQKMRESFNK